MTPKITLTLADDTTATHCGLCVSCSESCGYEFTCGAFDKRLAWDESAVDTLRLPECIAAAEAHAALEREAHLGRTARERISGDIVELRDAIAIEIRREAEGES